MPRLIAALPLLATVILAACNQQSTQESAAKTGEVSLTNAAPSEVAKQARAAGPAHFAPGEWETIVEVTDMDMDMPGMTPQMHAQMQAKLKSSRTAIKSCMTPEQAAKPETSLLTGKTDTHCTYRNFTMAGGRIDATLVCANPGGLELTQTIAGTFTETSFTTTAASEMNGGPRGSVKTKARSTGTRIGDCKPS